jgi:hypothetical protein
MRSIDRLETILRRLSDRSVLSLVPAACDDRYVVDRLFLNDRR